MHKEAPKIRKVLDTNCINFHECGCIVPSGFAELMFHVDRSAAKWRHLNLLF